MRRLVLNILFNPTILLVLAGPGQADTYYLANADLSAGVFG